MKLVIHNLAPDTFKGLFLKRPIAGLKIVENDGTIKTCTGCFDCWIKTPGKCVLEDSYRHMATLLSQADEVDIISQCCFGGYSPFVKTVLDRCIGYLLPAFKVNEGTTRHKLRYDHAFNMTVYFYGSHLSEHEQSLALEMVRANSQNFLPTQFSVQFFSSPQHMAGEVRL